MSCFGRNPGILAATWSAGTIVLSLAGVWFEPAVAARATTHTVLIDGLKYEPGALRVTRGDTVIWINKDPYPHTVTARGVFDSKQIPAGQSWQHTMRKAGGFTYICTLHPNMSGTLDVE